MSEEELNAIEARLLRVPAPPWGEFCESGEWWIETRDVHGNPTNTVICNSNSEDMTQEVADFIVAAPSDIEALLAEVQRLRATLGVAEVNAATIRDALIHGLGLANELGEGERWAAWRLTAHTALSGEPTL